MKDRFQTNPLQGTKLKHMAIQLNTFLNFLRKVGPDLIWLRGEGSLFECTPEENEESATYRKTAVNGYIFSH